MKRRVAALSAYCSAIAGLTASGLILGTLGVSGQEILYEHPNAEAVEIRSEVVQGSDVAVDLYYPADRGDGPIPAVILVIGYPDDALPVGSLKDTGYYRSWGRLLVLCSQSRFRFLDLGDDALCGSRPDERGGVVVTSSDVGFYGGDQLRDT